MVDFYENGDNIYNEEATSCCNPIIKKSFSSRYKCDYCSEYCCDCVHLCLCSCGRYGRDVIGCCCCYPITDKGSVIGFYTDDSCCSLRFILVLFFVLLIMFSVWFLIIYFLIIPCFQGNIKFTHTYDGVITNGKLTIQNTPCVFFNVSGNGFVNLLFENYVDNCFLNNPKPIQQYQCNINNFILKNYYHKTSGKHFGYVILLVLSFIVLFCNFISFISLWFCKINYYKKFTNCC
jgi:hypothetical protein